MRADCNRHFCEPAIDVCGGCADGFCRDCLVYPFGPRTSPYCLDCAVRAAGVRQRGGFGSGRKGRAHRALVAERRALLFAGATG